MDGARAKSASAQCDGRGSCASVSCLRSLTKLVADLDDLLSFRARRIFCILQELWNALCGGQGRILVQQVVAFVLI